MREIPPEQRMAAIAAIVLVLSMALPWYQRTVDPGAGSELVSKSLSAFGVFTFVEAAVLLVAGRRAVPDLGALGGQGLPPARAATGS